MSTLPGGARKPQKALRRRAWGIVKCSVCTKPIMKAGDAEYDCIEFKGGSYIVASVRHSLCRT